MELSLVDVEEGKNGVDSIQIGGFSDVREDVLLLLVISFKIFF